MLEPSRPVPDLANPVLRSSPAAGIASLITSSTSTYPIPTICSGADKLSISGGQSNYVSVASLPSDPIPCVTDCLLPRVATIRTPPPNKPAYRDPPFEPTYPLPIGKLSLSFGLITNINPYCPTVSVSRHPVSARTSPEHRPSWWSRRAGETRTSSS